MEGRKHFSSTSSSSSSTSSIVSELPELFPKESSQFSSSGIFDSVFAPASKTAVRREMSVSEASVSWKKHQQNKTEHTKQPSSDGISQTAERDGRYIPIKDGNPGYTGEVVEHSLSSSVHYGGRDDYIEPPSTQTYSGTSSTIQFGKNSGEDVSDGGSPRGNWWQGSYYY